MIILLGLVLLIACLWSLSNPFVAMITLMGVNIIEPGQLYPIFAAIHVERVVALLALIVLFARGYRFVYPAVTRWCLYFYAACLASIPFAFWIGNAITNAIDFGKVIVIHLLYVTLVNTRQRMKIVLISFCCLVGYLSVTSLNLYFHGQFQSTMNVDRITGLAGSATSADSLGLTMVTAIPIIYLFTRRSSSTSLRAVMWLVLALAIWTLSLSGTRGPVITFVLMLILGAAIHHRRLIILPLAVAVLPIAWLALPAQYQARYATVTNLKNDDSYQNRLLSWDGGWHMFLHNPLTGIGIGDYTFANGAKYWPAPRKVYLNAHSVYFQVLGELGLGGAVTFIGLLVVLIGTNNRVRQRLKQIEAAARAGVSGAQPVPDWLLLFPTACTLSIIGLLYTGYAYHDLYRSTWYFLAATSGGIDLITAREIAALNQSPAEAPSLPAGSRSLPSPAWGGVA